MTLRWPDSNRNTGRLRVGSSGRLQIGMHGRFHRNPHAGRTSVKLACQAHGVSSVWSLCLAQRLCVHRPGAVSAEGMDSRSRSDAGHAHVPDTVAFATKPALASIVIGRAIDAEVPFAAGAADTIWTSPARTGRKSTPQTRSSGSTARSSAAPMSSASSPTTMPSSGSLAPPARAER